MTVPANILVVDDDESMRIGCVKTLTEEGYGGSTADSGMAALRMAKEESFDVIILDLKMPGLSGMEVLAKLREESPSAVVVVITGYATIESAVSAMRSGAYDYLRKPFSPEMLVAVVKRALDRRLLAVENLCLRLALKDKGGPDTIIGSSPVMAKVVQLVQKVGPTDATVLLVGETGVGKEMVARALHRASLRCDKPFVAVDCGALVQSLFESELFGHIRGAFTGAFETTMGKFELANRGTIFLDEIGNIGPDVQAKLLRVIQERELVKVGSTQRVKIDVRIIAATNSDLVSGIKSGKFREELFYRLSVVPIPIPPLRERREDIRALAQHFLKRLSHKMGRRMTGIAEEALRVLDRYDWPGNVRELENTIERAIVLAEGNVIQPIDLFFYGTVQPPSQPEESAVAGRLAEVERQEVVAALDHFEGQMAKVAQYLGIHRKTLREKIRKYGISRR